MDVLAQAGRNIAETDAGGLCGPRNPAFMTYLRSCFADACNERLHVTYVDAGGWYLGDEMLALGGAHYASIRARLLFTRAFAAEASGFILAHNHPSGVCRPSPVDIHSTNKVRYLASALDMVLVDHLILTQNETYSMQSGNIM